jgi:hypothetical protein
MKTKDGGLSRADCTYLFCFDQHMQNTELREHDSNIFKLSKLIFMF